MYVMKELPNFENVAKQVENYNSSDVKGYEITILQIFLGGFPVLKAVISEIFSDCPYSEEQLSEIIEPANRKLALLKEILKS